MADTGVRIKLKVLSNLNFMRASHGNDQICLMGRLSLYQQNHELLIQGSSYQLGILTKILMNEQFFRTMKP